MEGWLLLNHQIIFSIEILQKGDALEPIEPWLSMENIGTW